MKTFKQVSVIYKEMKERKGRRTRKRQRKVEIGMKIKKIMKTFAIAAVMASSIFTFSQTTKAATVSIEKAAEKIYKAETKAYETKKDVSVTVKVAAPSKTKKAIQKVIENVEDALIKEELGDVDLTYVMRGRFIRPSIGKLVSRLGKDNCDSGRRKTKYFYYPAQDAAIQNISYKNGVLIVKFDIKGSKKWYRDQYYENTCLAKCVEELRELTDGLSEKDKAWTVGMWVQDHFWYDGDYDDGSKTAYSLIWKRDGACGDCEQEAIANQLFACLMGLNTGYVCDDVHAWNCVKIDGEIYYFDGTDSLTGDWEAFNKGQANALKISTIAEFKEWVDGTTIGEWCLLTQDEFIQSSADDWNPDEWEIYWKLGRRSTIWY